MYIDNTWTMLFAFNITEMTDMQKERSRALQEIMDEMAKIAQTNADGAKSAYQNTEALAYNASKMAELVEQFKV